MTDEEKLKFAVRFSQMPLLDFMQYTDGKPLPAMREGDILNLKDDLLAFANLEQPEEVEHAIIQTQFASLDDKPGATYAFPDVGTPNFWPRDYSLAHLVALQSECSRILESAVNGVGDRETNISLKFSLFRGPKFNCTFLFLTGPFRDIFLYTLFHLINAAERNSILRCPEPNCRRIFYRVRKQRFCSHRCAVRASVRRKEKGLAKPRAKKLVGNS
jgi:hypothetical protein